MYNHYIRVDSNNIIIDRYSDWEGKYQAGDILVEETEERHYNFPITNMRGQFIYKWDGTQQEERTQTELDAEWSARPVPPDPDEELAAAIQAATTLDGLKAALLGNGKLARVKGKMK